MLSHLDTIDTQLAALDRELERIAQTEPWADPVRWLSCFRGISTLTALSLLAEIGDFRVTCRRCRRARRLASATRQPDEDPPRAQTSQKPSADLTRVSISVERLEVDEVVDDREVGAVVRE